MGGEIWLRYGWKIMSPEEALERLDKAALTNSAGRPYRAFRASLAPRYAVVWRDIALGYLMIVVGLAGVGWGQQAGLWLGVALAPLGAVFTGYWLAYLNLFVHEASHYNLAPDRGLNDLLTNVFLCVLFGMSIEDYRRIHWDHHRLHGTTMDSEHSYFSPLTLGFMLRALFGLKAVEVIMARRRRLAAGRTEKGGRLIIVGLLVNGVFVLGLAWSGWWAPALAWAAGMLMFCPFFGAVRQLLEHRDELAGPEIDFTKIAHGRINRMFGDSLLAQTLGGAGFNRHLLHHWEPNVSYTRLPDLEAFLRDTAAGPWLEARRSTYLDTARRLYRRGKLSSPAT